MSNDIYNVGNYHMIVKGEVLPYSLLEFDIFVIVTKSCNDMFMTKYAPPNFDYSLFEDNLVTTIFSEW